MNKAKIFFTVTFTIIVAFIVILTLYYSKALKKKIHLLYQLGTPVPRSENVEPDYAAIEIKFSSDDSKLITLLNNGNMELWNLETKTKVTVFNTDSLFSYCKSNNSIILATLKFLL